jgi:hypothetical protein
MDSAIQAPKGCKREVGYSEFPASLDATGNFGDDDL